MTREKLTILAQRNGGALVTLGESLHAVLVRICLV